MYNQIASIAMTYIVFRSRSTAPIEGHACCCPAMLLQPGASRKVLMLCFSPDSPQSCWMVRGWGWVVSACALLVLGWTSLADAALGIPATYVENTQASLSFLLL